MIWTNEGGKPETLVTLEEAKHAINTDYDYLFDSDDWEDSLDQIADDYTAVYTREIIFQWALLPNDDMDMWHEYLAEGVTGNRGIVDLMRIDLYAYNCQIFRKAYEELTEEKGE